MIKDLDLTVKVCKLYYENDYTFVQIGKLLKLSRFQVANIIKKAKQSGIVKITIEDKFIDENIKLASLVEETFKINRVIIVDNNNLPEDELRKRIGYTAANFLVDILKDKDVISLTTSSTVNAILDTIKNKNNVKNIKIVEANGGSNITYSHSVHEISRKFAKIFDATHYSINAPIVVDSEETREILLREKNIKRTIELFDEVNILVFGIGAFYPKINKLMIESGDLHKDEFKALKELKAVGNILYYYYDINGNFLKTPFDNRIICFNKEKIKNVQYTIGVVYGTDKKYGLLGGLRTGCIKFLILDSLLAKEVLKIKDVDFEEFEEDYVNNSTFNKMIESL